MGRPDQLDSGGEAFAVLEPRVKHVSESTIRKKWKKLPSINHASTREIILSAQNQCRERKARGGIHAGQEECVAAVASKLVDRLPRIPLPPSTEEHHFDHETNLHNVTRVEEQLTSNTHSINLLRAQITKEEKLLKKEQKEVEYLEQSLKSSEAYRREQGSTLHPIAKSLGERNQEIDLMALHGHSNETTEPIMNQVLQDEDLRAILASLHDHLDNLEGNHNAIRDIKAHVDLATHELLIGTFD